MHKTGTDGERNRPLKENLRDMNSDLHSAIIDGIVGACSTKERYKEVETLLTNSETHRRGRDWLSPLSRLRAPLFLRRFFSILQSNERPNEEIVELLIRLGLDEQLVAYYSRFFGSCPKAVPRAFERLQVNILDPPDGPVRAPDRRIRFEVGAGYRLDFFRLAQRIRNEYGTTPGTSSFRRFYSYEDIIDLERKFDAVDSLIQGDAIRPLTCRNLAVVYKKTSSFSQLETFHDAVSALADRILRQSVADRLYSTQFSRLLMRGLEPKLRDFKRYLKVCGRIDWCASYTFDTIGTAFVEETPDEALNFIINRIGYIAPTYVDTVLELLQKGANLYFKDPDEKRSTLVALVTLCQRSESQASKLAPHICCPMRYRGGKVNFDDRQVAWLSCLAARKASQGDDLIRRLPSKLRYFVEAHQDLERELSRR